jgi:hypothetical protein
MSILKLDFNSLFSISGHRGTDKTNNACTHCVCDIRGTLMAVYPTMVKNSFACSNPYRGAAPGFVNDGGRQVEINRDLGVFLWTSKAVLTNGVRSVRGFRWCSLSSGGKLRVMTRAPFLSSISGIRHRTSFSNLKRLGGAVTGP